MRLRRAALLATLVVVPALFAATPGLEFTGVLTVEDKTSIALTDRSANHTSWHAPGDVINGFTLARYDAKEEAVYLKKNGEEIRLGLVPAKTSDATIAQIPAAPVPAAPALGGTPRPPSVVRTAAPPPIPPSATASASLPASPGTTPSPPSVPPITPSTTAGASSTLPPGTTSTAPDPTNASAAAATANPTAPATGAIAAIPSSTQAPAEAALPPTGRQPASPTHTIQGGDTLDSIALTHGVSVQRIRELNPTLNNSTSLRSGETIRIR